MRVLVTGGRGRLGRQVVAWLEGQGHTVAAPDRGEVDWADPDDVRQARVFYEPDVVLALAAWTDVPGAQRDPASCVRDTVLSAQVTVDEFSFNAVPLRYVSTDYVMAVLRGTEGAGVYAAAKLAAEQLVLLTGERVARVAFVTRQEAERWTWVDGSSLACRCWDDELVPQLAAWALAPNPPPLVHLGGPEPVTLADMLRRRYPAHRALQNIVADRERLTELSGMPRPPDTSWLS